MGLHFHVLDHVKGSSGSLEGRGTSLYNQSAASTTQPRVLHRPLFGGVVRSVSQYISAWQKIAVGSFAVFARRGGVERGHGRDSFWLMAVGTIG
jgi:hypothetical protein